jgi:hypothetical protein
MSPSAKQSQNRAAADGHLSNVRVVGNEVSNRPPELEELEFPVQQLKVHCVFRPGFVVTPRPPPKTARNAFPKRASKPRWASSAFYVLNDSPHADQKDRNLGLLTLKDEFRPGHCSVASCVMV